MTAAANPHSMRRTISGRSEPGAGFPTIGGAEFLDIREPSLRREQPRGTPLQEHHHQPKNDHLGPHRLENRLEQLVDHPESKPGPDRPRQLSDAARYDHQE